MEKLYQNIPECDCHEFTVQRSGKGSDCVSKSSQSSPTKTPYRMTSFGATENPETMISAQMPSKASGKQFSYFPSSYRMSTTTNDVRKLSEDQLKATFKKTAEKE